MKKLLLALLTLLAVIVTVVTIRTAFYFSDKQVAVSSTTNNNGVKFQPDINAAAKRLSSAIHFRTISTDDGEFTNETEFAAFLAFLKRSYPTLWQQYPPEHFSEHSLLFHIKSDKPEYKPIMFLAHTDVVPVDAETEDKWRFPPFAGVIENDIIWGRGAIDDKSGVMALMEVAEYMLVNDIQPPRDIYVAFGHDEEIGGTEGASKIAALLREKNIEFEFILDEGGVITEGIMPGINQPLALIGVAEKGFVNFRLTAHGTGGHSSQPPKNTAAGLIAQAIVNIENSPFPADLSFMEMTFDKIGYYADLSMKVPFSNLWLLQSTVESAMLASRATAASIRTTAAATMLKGSAKSNVLPTEASAVVNFRIFPRTSIAQLQQRLTEIVNNAQIKIEPFMGVEASSISSTNSASFKLLETTIRSFDDDILVAPYLVIAGTDAKHYQGLSENIYRFMMVSFTPESLSRIHGIDEHISFKDYQRVIEFYYQLMTAKVSS